MKNKHIASLSREQREQRRLLAAKLFKKNIPQAEIARKLRVTPAAVNYWHIAWEKNGIKGLKSKGPTGFPSKLTPQKRVSFKEAVLKGPKAYGYETNLWTLERLSAVMKKSVGIKFGHNHTWEIVRELGFTPQKPQLKAKERNEQAITEWKKKRLPGLKKMGSKI
jgi:putative transposase